MVLAYTFGLTCVLRASEGGGWRRGRTEMRAKASSNTNAQLRWAVWQQGYKALWINDERSKPRGRGSSYFSMMAVPASLNCLARRWKKAYTHTHAHKDTKIPCWHFTVLCSSILFGEDSTGRLPETDSSRPTWCVCVCACLYAQTYKH